MIIKSHSTQEARDKWFDELLASLSTHKLMLDHDIATKDLQQHYTTLIEGNTDDICHHGKQLSQKHFVSKIIVEYLTLLQKENHLPQKLAFDMNDTEVLVWAQINSSNEELEKQLILAEAKVNAKYHKYGYDMTSMIVEDSDGVPIPNHYIELQFQA